MYIYGMLNVIMLDKLEHANEKQNHYKVLKY